MCTGMDINQVTMMSAVQIRNNKIIYRQPSSIQPMLNAVEEQKYVDAIQQNVLSRQVSCLSGGGDTERNRRRVDGSSTWGFIDWRQWRWFRGLPCGPGLAKSRPQNDRTVWKTGQNRLHAICCSCCILVPENVNM